MALFKASEFPGLAYDVPPGTPYQDIFAEAVSERERVYRVGGSLRFAQLGLTVSNAGRRLGLVQSSKDIDDSIQILTDAGDAASIAWGHWSKANHCQQVGQHAEALRHYQRALLFASDAHAGDAARYAIAGRAEIDRILGRYGTAIPDHMKARELFRSVDDYRGVVWADEGLAQMALRLGRLGDAQISFQSALINATEIDDLRGIAWARRGIAEVAFRSGDLFTAKNFATRSYGDFKLAGVIIGAGYSKITSARILRAEHDYCSARSEISLAENIFHQTRHARGLFWSKKLLAAMP